MRVLLILILLSAPVYAQTPNDRAKVESLAQQSSNWAACRQGIHISCHLFVRQFIEAVNPTCDKQGWGLLSKSPGQQQCTLHECGPGDGSGYGEDAIIYGRTNQVVDIISGAGGTSPAIAWQPVSKRPDNNWACLGSGGSPIPTPNPSPVPTPTPQPNKELEELKALVAVLQAEVKALSTELSKFEEVDVQLQNNLDNLSEFTHERFGLNEKWIVELQARPQWTSCRARFAGIGVSCSLVAQ